jgi:hypothetical protein
MCHLWNYNIFLIINLCLTDYLYIVCLLILMIQIITLLLNLFINIIYDDSLIIYYTYKSNSIGKIITYYNHNKI